MSITKTADIKQNRMNMECNIPEAIQQGKINNKRRCMHEIYDETQSLYLETDASRVRLGAALLQTRSGTSCLRYKVSENSILRPLAFASKSLSSAERRYSNIEGEALGILHGLKKFHHYCFVREVSIIRDHRPLVAIFKKDVAILTQRTQ